MLRRGQHAQSANQTIFEQYSKCELVSFLRGMIILPHWFLNFK